MLTYNIVDGTIYQAPHLLSRRWRTAAKAAATIRGGGACNSRARRGETSGGSSSFVQTLIAAWSVATALSQREEHAGGFVCARFSTVREIWRIY
ncbi:hypothetical protein YC2023_060606 [Brassica napus]